MKIKKMLAVAALLIALPFGANAVPVRYDITFGSNASDADGGAGSFFWDQATTTFSNLTWNFGGGLSGGATTNFSQVTFGGTLGQFLFEILTQQNSHPAACNTASLGCGVSFSGSSGLTGPFTHFGFNDNTFGPLQTYSYSTGSGFYTGTFSTRLASVPEPALLALLALALLGVAFTRRSDRPNLVQHDSCRSAPIDEL